jgi:hypothetical protein
MFSPVSILKYKNINKELESGTHQNRIGAVQSAEKGKQQPEANF